MKLVSVFVEGTVETAVAFLEENHLSLSFKQMLPGQRIIPHAIDDGWHSPTIQMGHYVICEVTDHMAATLRRKGLTQ